MQPFKCHGADIKFQRVVEQFDLLIVLFADADDAQAERPAMGTGVNRGRWRRFRRGGDENVDLAGAAVS